MADSSSDNGSPPAPLAGASDNNDNDRDRQDGGGGGIARPKRLACTICRRRKLRCDGGRPRCGTCARLGHAWAYDEQRRKSGPKRGYVKALEERLSELGRAPVSRPSPALGTAC